MDDYSGRLLEDLAQQFKNKPHITALMETIGFQLQELAGFYESLQTDRSIQTAQGVQLDGIGDIVQLSRAEAGKLASIANPDKLIDDTVYRQYLIHKIFVNTNICTYPDIIRSLRLFWDKPLRYREDPEQPATMIFETETLSPEDDVPKLINAPLVKAAGVSIKVIAKTSSSEMLDMLTVEELMGRGYTSTVLPEIPVPMGMEDTVRPIPIFENITQTKLPEMEE